MIMSDVASSRIELRLHHPKALLALVESAAAFRDAFGLPAATGLRDFFVSGDVSSAWLEELRRAEASDPWKFGFAVVDCASQQVVGSAGFKGAPDDEGMAEVAYAIVPEFEGKGIATEALSRLVEFAFDDPRVRVLRAHTLPTKNASCRVLEKNGFRHVGEVNEPEDGLVWRWERSKVAAEKTSTIRVQLPFHLKNLARVEGEVELEIAAPVTIKATLDALEAKFPALRGTIREHGTLKRRPFIRFFACKEDLSLESPDTLLPDEVVSGKEPFMVIGAMAGG